MGDNSKCGNVIVIGEDNVGIVDVSSSMVSHQKESWTNPNNFHNAYLEYLQHATNDIAKQNQGVGTSDDNNEDGYKKLVPPADEISSAQSSWNSQLFATTKDGAADSDNSAQEATKYETLDADEAQDSMGSLPDDQNVLGIEVCAYTANRSWKDHEAREFLLIVPVENDAAPRLVFQKSLEMRWHQHMYRICISSISVASGNIHLQCTSGVPLPVLSGMFGHFMVENCPHKVPFAAKFCSCTPPASKKFMEISWDKGTDQKDGTVESKIVIERHMEEPKRVTQEKLREDADARAIEEAQRYVAAAKRAAEEAKRWAAEAEQTTKSWDELFQKKFLAAGDTSVARTSMTEEVSACFLIYLFCCTSPLSVADREADDADSGEIPELAEQDTREISPSEANDETKALLKRLLETEAKLEATEEKAKEAEKLQQLAEKTVEKTAEKVTLVEEAQKQAAEESDKRLKRFAKEKASAIRLQRFAEEKALAIEEALQKATLEFKLEFKRVEEEKQFYF